MTAVPELYVCVCTSKIITTLCTHSPYRLYALEAHLKIIKKNLGILGIARKDNKVSYAGWAGNDREREYFFKQNLTRNLPPTSHPRQNKKKPSLGRIFSYFRQKADDDVDFHSFLVFLRTDSLNIHTTHSTF
jgi:hypothetical protein